MRSSSKFQYSPVGDDLLGLIEYYDAVFGKAGITARVGEFRSFELSMIIDLLETLDISIDLKSDLSSSLIRAWRLDTPEGCESELRYLREKMASIRKAISWAKENPGPYLRQALDVAVLLSLPLRNSDLKEDGVQNIHDQLNRVMEVLGTRMGGEPLTV